MKKIFAIIMTICLMASALCVTTFAAESTDGFVITVSAEKEDGTVVKLEDYPSFEAGWNFAMEKAKDPQADHVREMERIGCNTCAGVLAGAMYAVLAGRGDFDTSAIIAVNHSGKSAAVGAVTGAILGASMGEDSLPEFYLECLESAKALRTLATDLWHCYLRPGTKRLFDTEWDQKYTHGQPVDREENL